MSRQSSDAAVAARLRAAGCVFAEDEARLISDAGLSPAAQEALIARRVAGEPLEYLLGWVAFCGLRVRIDAGVFIPRQRTEFLVREAARLAPPGATVLDLCCGSGALGLAVHALAGPGEVHAADLDPVAVRCARRNLDPMGGSVYHGDLFAPLPERLRGHVDVLLANVPYVPTGELVALPAEARDHEPARTHDGGPDGLDVLRRVLADAPRWLAPGGHLLVEISPGQRGAARAAFRAAGLAVRVAGSEEYQAIVALGTRPAITR